MAASKRSRPAAFSNSWERSLAGRWQGRGARP
jgi:hypothetical protein